jgi:nitrite reductase (NAD(P)H)
MAEARGESSSTLNDAKTKMLPDKVAELRLNGEDLEGSKRKRLVVVGLGMVGIAFM